MSEPSRRRDTAILLTDGRLATSYAKTAHGLIRGPSRYEVIGVIDAANAGSDAGAVLDGRERGIPVFASLADGVRHRLPDVLVVGVATHGGVCPPALQATLREGARRGISLVNGLHDLLGDDPELVAACATNGASILDIRRPRRFGELHVWSGEVLRLRPPRVAVLGMDCAMGKRTTCALLLDACRQAGIAAEMVYTGQTGWLQGYAHGFILDATPNDFVSGELEHAILTCAAATSPDLILIEGQSALRNPAGPCGAELLLSAGARGAVLVHAPGRTHFDGLEELGCRLPPLADEVELIGRYGARVLAIALNTDGLSAPQADEERVRLARTTGLPVALPLAEGVGGLLAAIRAFLAAERST